MINAFYNGVFCDFREVEIQLSDRSVFFGDAVYEMLLGRGEKLYDFDAHRKRLMKSCEYTKIEPPKDLEKSIEKLLKFNEFACYSLYIQVSRTGEKREHSPRGEIGSSLLITLEEAHPEEYKKTISSITTNDRRGSLCHIKSVNLLPNVLASIEASEKGSEEAILIRNGIVTEGSKSTCFILFGGELITHPLNEYILPGTTRARLLKIAPTIGIKVREEIFPVDDLFRADEVLISSSTKLARRIGEINGIAVGGRDSERARVLQDALYRDFWDTTG